MFQKQVITVNGISESNRTWHAYAMLFVDTLLLVDIFLCIWYFQFKCHLFPFLPFHVFRVSGLLCLLPAPPTRWNDEFFVPLEQFKDK